MKKNLKQSKNATNQKRSNSVDIQKNNNNSSRNNCSDTESHMDCK